MNLVRQLRRQSGMTQHELAVRAGTSQSTIAAYETGAKSPSLQTLERLASTLGLVLDAKFVPALTREDRRSLAYHHAVADKLRARPHEILRHARKNLERLRSMHPLASPLLSQWAVLLELPPDLLAIHLLDTTEISRELRQVSPFAGVLTAGERTRVLKRFRSGTAA